ncbi:sensor histidine kinase [Micromonospora sp. CPCC 206061]|uniref:sensor histidine kinase n=1 Tax=Micromonospora sp. CPCC 206061 TaxID=3122410 RepID=UPI002FF07D12
MQGLLRSVWDEPRPPGAPHRVWRDWALVAVLVPLVVLEAVVRWSDLHAPVVALVITAGLMPTLLWRRTRPLLMVAIAFGTCAVTPLFTGAEPDMNSLAFMILLPYAVFRWGSGREAVLGLAIMYAKLGLAAALGDISLGEAGGGSVVLFAAMAVGAAVRYRAGARLRELDQAKLLERERLARDLHDTVAHHVSAMAIRAQAGLATAPADPAAATDALRVIEAEATQALAEMRAMVRVLRRGEPAERAPTPRVSDLDQLAGRTRPGPAVEVELVGDVDALPPPVGTAIYRLAQESVTNARRHARHATRIEVRVAVDDAAVRLRVSDDGEATAARQASSSGYGLVGMMERAGLLGGTCEAGPAPDRGWTVTAVLPRTAS